MVLNEHQAKQLLARAGLQIPSARVVDSVDDAVAAGEMLLRESDAVAVKTVSAGLMHKTESGLVAVNLRDAQGIREHAARMLAQPRFAGDARLMVETMIDESVAELLLGVGYDAQFGRYLIIGAGGTLVELLGDRELILPPIDEKSVRRALAKLTIAPLLNGYRGRPRADVDAVVQSAMRLSGMLTDDSTVIEIEINPLIVRAQHRGAWVADAVIAINKSKT